MISRIKKLIPERYKNVYREARFEVSSELDRMYLRSKARIPEKYQNIYREVRYDANAKLDRIYLLSKSQDQLMRRIATGAEAYVADRHIAEGKRILYPTSYYHVQFNRVIDYILPISLKLRGARIIPVLCNGFHAVQCSVLPGVFATRFPRQCRELCNDPGHILWEKLLGYKPLRLTDYREESDKSTAAGVVAGIDHDNYSRYNFMGFEVGAQAAEVVANGNNLSKVLPGEPCASELQLHAKNAVEMLLAYERLIDEVQPDVCVGTLHDHYQWSSLYHTARAAGVDYYSYAMLDKEGCVSIGKNVRNVCEVDGAWPSFREAAVESGVWQRFDVFMARKADGETTYFDLYPKLGAKECDELVARLDPEKPVAFFPVNVPWDNAIHNHCFVAGNIGEMVERIIRFFESHPEFQLIIKSHPMELAFDQYEDLPHTLRRILEDIGARLGENVFFID